MNYRVFHKRALYLSIVAGHLIKKKKLISSLDFTYDLNYPLLPILALTPKGNNDGTIVHVMVIGRSIRAWLFFSMELAHIKFVC